MYVLLVSVSVSVSVIMMHLKPFPSITTCIQLTLLFSCTSNVHHIISHPSYLEPQSPNIPLKSLIPVPPSFPAFTSLQLLPLVQQQPPLPAPSFPPNHPSATRPMFSPPRNTSQRTFHLLYSILNKGGDPPYHHLGTSSVAYWPAPRR